MYSQYLLNILFQIRRLFNIYLLIYTFILHVKVNLFSICSQINSPKCSLRTAANGISTKKPKVSSSLADRWKKLDREIDR